MAPFRAWRTGLLLLVAAGGGCSSSGYRPHRDAKLKEGWVRICHIPEQRSAARYTTVVKRENLVGHVAHGDTAGACRSGN